MTFSNMPDAPEKGAGGRNQKPLLLVLLALVAVFAYLYFFTGLIKPRPEEQPAPPPVAQVKKPLPPRPEGEPGTPEKPTAEPGAPKGEAKEPKEKAKAGEPAAKTPPSPPPAPAAKAPEKPAPAKALPAKEAVKQGAGTGDQGTVKAAKPAASQNAAAKPTAADTATKGKKPEPAAKPAAAKVEGAKAPAVKDKAKAAPVKKDVVAKESAKGGSKKVKEAKSAAVTIFVGEFVPDKEFLALQAKLKKMGLSPLHKTELKKAKPMNRIFVGEYPNYDAGSAELEKVKKLSGDAFFIGNNGAYRVYAGSYFNAKMAEQVKADLARKGVTVSIQKTEVPVSVVRLTAGRFTDKAAAAAAIRKLKADGFTPSVVQVAK